MIDLSKDDDSPKSSPKTTIRDQRLAVTQSKPTPRAAQKFSTHMNNNELKSQKTSKSSSPELLKIEKNWVTMVDDDLWIYPPRGPARKLSQEEVTELEQNGFQKRKPSSPPRSQKMTIPHRTHKTSNPASPRTAPKRSFENVTITK